MMLHFLASVISLDARVCGILLLLASIETLVLKPSFIHFLQKLFCNRVT